MITNVTPVTIKRLGVDRPENFTGKCVVAEDRCSIDKGTTLYFKDGFLHREDGPAVLFEEGLEAYFINGIGVTKKAHDLLILLYKLKDIKIL